MSPEMVKREKYTDKIDSWAIGILTYTLLFGASPFDVDVDNEDSLSEEEEIKLIYVIALFFSLVTSHRTISSTTKLSLMKRRKLVTQPRTSS